MPISILDNYLHDFDRHKRRAEEALEAGDLRTAESEIADMDSCAQSVISEGSGMEYETEELWRRFDVVEAELEAF